MKKLFGSSRGQIAVLYAGVILGLLGAIALCTDVGVIYLNWHRMQKAVDPAVLAGGAGLPDNLPGATA
ncbi:TadE/TadG family type IV pilus assembly protein, partial [Candidatus Binatus sp.]|uniref:TadE/TadG family type IV pilus assembly protein n=1 Tax=Candidatus Binatus sp. TaxID=2811406 RepID=UPI002FDA25B9